MISWVKTSNWSNLKVLSIFWASKVVTALKVLIKVIEMIGDEVECCNSLRQVPFRTSQIRTEDPEALKAMGKAKMTLLIGPECPDSVNNEEDTVSAKKINEFL